MKVKELIHNLLLFSVDSEVALDASWDDAVHPITEIYKDESTNKVIITA